MCKPASMIVTKKKVFWSEKTDSHHEIITEFDIRETDARGNINIVPVEIFPEDGNLNTPVSKWKFEVDYNGYQRDLPEWWDADKYEKEVRSAVKHWKKAKVVTRKRKALSGGHFYLCGTAYIETVEDCTLEMWDSSTVNRMRDSSTVKEMWGSSTVKEMRGSSTVNRMWDSSTVNRMWDSSTVNRMWDSSTVKEMRGSSTVKEMRGSSTVKEMRGSSTVNRMWDSSTVLEIKDSCTVIAYHSLDLKCLKSSRAVIVDRSGLKVTVRTK